MWVGTLFLASLGLLFFSVTDATTCTCRNCPRCTGCSATACAKNGRALRLLDYLEIYDQEVKRQLDVISPTIPCSKADTFCPPPHNNYCCTQQADKTLTCGLGTNWGTCTTGTTCHGCVRCTTGPCRRNLYLLIQTQTTKNKCDFDFPCRGNNGNDCCGGLSLFNSEGPGYCDPSYCTSSSAQIVACNYIGISTAQSKTPDFDASLAVNNAMPTQDNTKYCGDNNISNRNSGRCRGSNLCCSPMGLCDITADSCATNSNSWSWIGGSTNQWVQTGAGSSIPCGNGVIGNGRCATDDSTYGITCCSDAGFCSSSYCNGADGNIYQCDCVNGSGGIGTRDCTTCAKCNKGYALNSLNFCDFVCNNGGTLVSATTCTCINGYTGADCGTAPTTPTVTQTPTTFNPTVVPSAGPTHIPSASPTITPTTTVAPTATTTVSCNSGRFITKINLSAGSYVNGITSITCSDNAVMQISTGLTGTAYTAISGDGTSSSLGYCSFKSGLSSSFVTQLKFVECTGGIDGTFGTTSATLTTVKCPTGQKAVGISFAGGGGSLASFAFVCGAITRNVSCASGMYIDQITLWSSDVVYGISSIACSDGTSKQVNTGLISGSANTASSSGGYCTYSYGLSGSFITQFALGECATSTTDGPFGSNTASITAHGCSSGLVATGVKIVTGTALTSFSFVCATVATAAPTSIPTQTPTPLPVPTAVPSSAPTTTPPPLTPSNVCTCANGTAATGSACTTNGANICSSCTRNYKLTNKMTCAPIITPCTSGVC